MQNKPSSPSPSSQNTGIASLGLAFPSLAFDVEKLALLRAQDPKKFSIGLGCGRMALCSPDENVADLALRAAKRALDRWNGDLDDIGLLAVGTESALDMSRPLSAWVAQELGLVGAVRSYEVKHACYGGTLALRQAIEWRRSGAARGKAALVIAADVALYAPSDPGEPTQGAGAVAMIVERPDVAHVDLDSFAWSEPVFDFWRPVGEDFPRVDGPLSLECYNRGAEKTLRAFLDAGGSVDQISAACFHVPFPKMVKKAVFHVGESLAWEEEQTKRFFSDLVEPTMEWNRECGNAYTGALWISVARALAGRAEGESLLAYSYGSGFGAELLRLHAGPLAAQAAWTKDVETDFSNRREISTEEYCALRGERPARAA